MSGTIAGNGTTRFAALRGDKEYPFSGVTIFGRVWKKVPESDSWSEHLTVRGIFCSRERERERDAARSFQ